MLIDCDSCAVRGASCQDCLVTTLLGAPGQEARLDEADQRALAVLADGGLIPPLRLVRRPRSGDDLLPILLADGDDDPGIGREAIG